MALKSFNNSKKIFDFISLRLKHSWIFYP